MDAIVWMDAKLSGVLVKDPNEVRYRCRIVVVRPARARASNYDPWSSLGTLKRARRTIIIFRHTFFTLFGGQVVSNDRWSSPVDETNFGSSEKLTPDLVVGLLQVVLIADRSILIPHSCKQVYA